MSMSILNIQQEEAERRADILEERVKTAEEQTHTLTRKKIETEAEIQRVRASAIKVLYQDMYHWYCMHCRVKKRKWS